MARVFVRADINRLKAALRHETDPEKRKEIAHQILRRTDEEFMLHGISDEAAEEILKDLQL
jgi:hypothetical protein